MENLLVSGPSVLFLLKSIIFVESRCCHFCCCFNFVSNANLAWIHIRFYTFFPFFILLLFHWSKLIQFRAKLMKIKIRISKRCLYCLLQTATAYDRNIIFAVLLLLYCIGKSYCLKYKKKRKVLKCPSTHPLFFKRFSIRIRWKNSEFLKIGCCRKKYS